MSLLDRSERAFRAMLRVMPSTVVFNGTEKPCVSQTLSIKKAQQLANYQVDASAQISMLKTDFKAFENIVERQSALKVNDGEELVFVQKDEHPQSAVVHLFLQARNAYG